MGSIDDGSAARNFLDRRRPVVGSEGPPDIGYVREWRPHTLSEDTGTWFYCRRAQPTSCAHLIRSRHDADARERALLADVKTNRFPVTDGDSGLQIDGRGIRPHPSAISGEESGSTPC